METSSSKFVFLVMLMRYFTVFVNCCHQICCLNYFCPNFVYFTLFSSFTLIFVTIYWYNAWNTMLRFHTIVCKDPYFLVYFWISLLEKIRLWRHKNDVIYKQLKAEVTSEEKLGLYCSPVIFCPHLNDTRGLRVMHVLKNFGVFIRVLKYFVKFRHKFSK